MGCKGNKTLESYFIEWTVPSGSLGSPRSVPCRLTAGEAGKSRAAVWPRLWVSIKQYGGGEEECNQPDMPLRCRLRLHTPCAPWWPVVAGRSAPARQQCGRTVVAPPVISLFDPQCSLLGACIWPGSALCEGAVCSVHPPGSLIEIKTIIAPITLPLHRVFGPVQR